MRLQLARVTPPFKSPQETSGLINVNMNHHCPLIRPAIVWPYFQGGWVALGMVGHLDSHGVEGGLFSPLKRDWKNPPTQRS